MACCRISGRRSLDNGSGGWTTGSPGATVSFCREGRPRRPSVGEWDLYRHPVLRHNRLFEHVTGLLDQLLGTDRITCRNVRQDQPPSLRTQRYLSGLARRRMPRLLRPLLLLLPKRRLVNQEISPLRRVDHRRAGPRVTGEHHQPPRTLRAHNPLGANLPPVRQLDRLAPLQLPPQVPFRNAGRPRFLGIEPPGPFVLAQGVSHRATAVLGPEYVNFIRIPHPASRIPLLASRIPNHLTGLHLNDLYFERDSLDAELKRLREQLLRTLRAIQDHGLRSHL